MKSETLLDSVVFQLTPTRTRYDLVIIANGKKEKISSGLLDPFLAHLKTAEDQITKGGYSIRLEPDPKTETAWFTKDTIERFVRYVSSPEVLDRVNTLETEIFQINEAIGKNIYNGDKEKTTVLSKHGKPRRMSTGSTVHEVNSRHQLLRVLESRKNVLQKEQGMALARAVAAGFDIDHMNNLISFAKSFGASRLLESCSKFVELWKATHKNGQCLETIGADNIMLSKKQYTETWIASSENLATTSKYNDNHIMATNSASHKSNLDYTQDSQACLGSQNYIPHMQNPMFHQWPTHAPRTSQPYLIQNMSYYHNYAYPSIDNQESCIKNGLKRHSVDPETNNFEFNALPQAEINQSKKAKSRSTSDVGSEKGIQDLPSDNDAENWQTFQKLLLRINQSDNTSAINCSNGKAREMNTQTEECQKRCSGNINDESYVALCGSSVQEKRVAMNMKADFDPEIKRENERFRYEPSELSMMPDRGMEKIISSFDPAKEFDMQMSLQNSMKKISGYQEAVSKRVRGETKGSRKEMKSKVDSITMKDKPSRLNSLADAKARAEKIRAFKADIQKVKKEKEDEERRRLEALKIERQKRITARSNSKTIQSSVNTSQTKAQKPAKSAPLPFNSSKFTDAKPTLLSPLKTANSSPNSYKSSKFSDRQPSPSSPLLKLIKNSKAIGQFAGSPQKNQMQKPTRLFPSSSPIRNSQYNFKSAPLCNTQDTRTQKPTREFSGPYRSTKETSVASCNVDRLVGNTPIVKISTSQIQNVGVQRREPYESNVNGSNMKASKENKTVGSSYEEVPIIEKTVVILENKAAVNVGVGSCEYYKSKKESSSCQVVKKSYDTYKTTVQIPISRPVIEEPTTSNNTGCSDARAPNKIGLNLVDKIEMQSKTYGIGSPRGFKDLLKFRKKSKSLSTDDLTAANTAPKLKDVLSQDSHHGATPSKVSRRSFSSFSPFNSKKKSEKKKIT